MVSLEDDALSPCSTPHHASKSPVAPCWSPTSSPPPSTATEFALRFQSTELYTNLLSQVELMRDPESPHPHYAWKDYETSRRPYPNSWWAELKLLSTREFLFVTRDRKTLGARLIQSFLLGILQSTIYWNVSPDATHTRFGSLYQVRRWHGKYHPITIKILVRCTTHVTELGGAREMGQERARRCG